MTGEPAPFSFDTARRPPRRSWPTIAVAAVAAVVLVGIFSAVTAFGMLTQGAPLRPILLKCELAAVVAGVAAISLVLHYSNALINRLAADAALGVILAAALITPVLVAGAEKLAYDQGRRQINPVLRGLYQKVVDSQAAYDRDLTGLGLAETFKPANLAQGFSAPAVRAALQKARASDAAFAAATIPAVAQARSKIAAVRWIGAWKAKALADFDEDFASKTGGFQQLRATHTYLLGMMDYQTDYLAKPGWTVKGRDVVFRSDADTGYYHWGDTALKNASIYIHNIAGSFALKAADPAANTVTIRGVGFGAAGY